MKLPADCVKVRNLDLLWINIVSGETSGQKRGAVGIFTGGLVNRDEMFGHIMKLLIGQRARNGDRSK